MATSPLHVPVLAAEILHWLEPQPGQTLVDGTLGGGGHTRLLAQRVGPSGKVIALDRDAAALEAAERNLKGQPVLLAHSNYCELPAVLAEIGCGPVDGVLLDLGLSSDQLADAARGFSFQSTGPLDLRFDTSVGIPAWQLLERLREGELADLIFKFGEERFSRRIARALVERRTVAPLRTAAELAALVKSAIPSSTWGKIDPATRTFQALRIAVNDELGSLRRALANLPDCVRPGGRIAIISFHSLEDRLVKEAFRENPRYHSLTRKPLTAGEPELAANVRSRSAKLRVCECVSAGNAAR